MKFNSDDIVSQHFETRFRGLDAQQVREFLQSVAREWDHLSEQLKSARQEVDSQARELKEYRRRERSLHDALEMAKQVAEEVRHQAERDAELLVAEAELKGERIVARAQGRLEAMRDELHKLQEQRIRFEAEMRSTLDSHVRMLDLFGGASSDYEILESRNEEVQEEPSGTDRIEPMNTEPGMTAS